MLFGKKIRELKDEQEVSFHIAENKRFILWIADEVIVAVEGEHVVDDAAVV